MNRRFLTTGQAALQCSVSPDTILKWIRSGILPARRTAGGHHRINEQDLLRLIKPANEPTTDPNNRNFRYCWEFYGNGEALCGCTECAVYLMRAQRCYEVANHVPDGSHHKTFCKNTCKNCDYFKHVHEQNTNVLVVTNDHTLIHQLENQTINANFNIKIVDCEYSCSTIVNNFRPDYAIVDCAMGPQTSMDISRHLIDDPRIPFIRIVLAGTNEEEFPNECEKIIFARIRRPFGIDAIRKCIDGSKNIN